MVCKRLLIVSFFIDKIKTLVYYDTRTLNKDGGVTMKFNDRSPIYIQIVDDIKYKILSGEYLPGEKLLSVRDLSLEYKVNPNTIQRVYQELEKDNIITIQRGLGTFVTEDELVIKSMRKDKAELIVKNFIKQVTNLGLDRNDVIDLVEKILKRGDINE